MHQKTQSIRNHLSGDKILYVFNVGDFYYPVLWELIICSKLSHFEESHYHKKPIGQPLFHHHSEVDLKWSGGMTFTRFVLNPMTAALLKIHPDL